MRFRILRHRPGRGDGAIFRLCRFLHIADELKFHFARHEGHDPSQHEPEFSVIDDCQFPAQHCV
ncbi:MAG: hypothetical protein ACI9TA_002903, partial [Reinekea sp.]